MPPRIDGFNLLEWDQFDHANAPIIPLAYRGDLFATYGTATIAFAKDPSSSPFLSKLWGDKPKGDVDAMFLALNRDEAVVVLGHLLPLVAHVITGDSSAHREALEEAGFNFNVRDLTANEAIEFLRQVHRELAAQKKDLTARSFKELRQTTHPHWPVLSTIVKAITGNPTAWNEALRIAGLTINMERDLTRDRAIGILKQAHAEVTARGEDFTARSYKRLRESQHPDWPSVGTITKIVGGRVGAWVESLRQAGLIAKEGSSSSSSGVTILLLSMGLASGVAFPAHAAEDVSHSSLEISLHEYHQPQVHHTSVAKTSHQLSTNHRHPDRHHHPLTASLAHRARADADLWMSAGASATAPLSVTSDILAESVLGI